MIWDPLYQNVLDRSASADEAAYWANLLDSNTLSQAQELVDFSETAENKAASTSVIDNGLWVPDPAAASVARLYYSAFDRAPDSGGLLYWEDLVKANSATLTIVADTFAQSAEFQADYGQLTNQQFVDRLYQNVLGRSVGVGEDAYWTGLLNSGTSRGAVLLGFSDSIEHQQALASVVDQHGINTV